MISFTEDSFNSKISGKSVPVVAAPVEERRTIRTYRLGAGLSTG